MKTAIISTITLFGAAALAAPRSTKIRRAEYDIGITLINDLTGASARGAVPSDANSAVTAAWPDLSPLTKDGQVLASSAQLISVNIPGAYCEILNSDGTVVDYVSTEKTYANIDGSEGPNPVDVSAWRVSCQIRKAAAPRSEYDATLSLSNDFLGKTAQSTVAVEYDSSVKALFAGTDIDINGRIIASSAQLTRFLDNLKCSFSNGIEMNGRDKTFADLDGTPEAKPIDITDLTFRCDLQ